MAKIRLKKEDMVVVIAGKDRDMQTPRRVLSVLREKNRVLVEGVNKVKVHTKPNPQKNIKGGILEREAPIHVSNVMLWDAQAKAGTRIGSKTGANGKRIRVSKKSGAELDK